MGGFYNVSLNPGSVNRISLCDDVEIEGNKNYTFKIERVFSCCEIDYKRHITVISFVDGTYVSC